MSTETGRRPITLKMISEKAGCSISSVSTVLNNSRGNSVVGDKTRRHILAIANELGYRPNFASRSLKTRRSRTVGVYVQPQLWRSLGNNYERQIFKGIEEAAFERNYDILVLNLSSRRSARPGWAKGGSTGCCCCTPTGRRSGSTVSATPATAWSRWTAASTATG